MLERSLPLALFILALTAADASAQASISFSPAKARAGETVTAMIRGECPNSCVPASADVTMSGRTIRIEARNPCIAGACAAVITPYTLTVTFKAPASEGSAGVPVEYSVIECGNERYLQTTAQLAVSGASCVFADSLVAQPESMTAGQPVTLSWCDPTTLVPDNSFTPRLYRVYRARAANGPFTAVADVQGATNTCVTLQTGVADAGATLSYYVEAHGCTTTISGACIETVIATKIVSVSIAPSSGCAPTATALCLGSNRFLVAARWRTSDGSNGTGRPVQWTNDSGYFWFFNKDNVEVTVKVLDACSTATPRFWVFSSGMTNVAVDLSVTDTVRGTTKLYKNTLGQSYAPVLDTNAFACR